ncbi:MAG: DUF4835 family protein [Bacteroidales bacterium]|nr:DUF4835 family protein [Bacteroidales bacterium]
MKTVRLIILLLCFACFGYGYAQELNMVVQVNAAQVQTSERRIFETLQSAIFEFINGRRWTTFNFSPIERIEGTLTLVIQQHDLQSNQISGTLSVQVRRPVWNSTYNSVLLNFIDRDITFQYAEGDPLLFADGTIHGNLTAILAFYANIAIGLSFSSFGRDAGMPFFDRAMDIAMRCQDLPAAEAMGWRSSSRNTANRFWLAENFTNGNLREIHDVHFLYHRRGMDQMYEDQRAARQAIFQSLEALQRVNRVRPNLLFRQIFFDAKSDEIVNIFRVAPLDERNRLVALMRELDPSNLNKYQSILG